jgi:hypothetical protein
MSNDFLSDEELAELEAELSELDDSDEPEAESASDNALEDATPPESEATEPELESDSDEDAGEDQELEAELNAIAHEDDSGTDLEPEFDPDSVAEDVEPEPVEDEAPATAAEPEQNSVEATNNTDTDDDDLTDMLLNASTSFNPRQLQKDLAFSENNLDDAFMSQPGFFAHYSGVSHRAARRHDQLSQQEKLVYAKIDNEVRQKAFEDGEKVTEPVVKNRILLDSRHRKITERMLDAKAVAGMTKDACESFKQRRDMLIQVGANVREEFKGDLRMRERQQSQDDVKNRAMSAMNQGK